MTKNAIIFGPNSYIISHKVIVCVFLMITFELLAVLIMLYSLSSEHVCFK